jgi:hypothetical protein
VDAPGEPIAAKKSLTSFAPAFLFQVASGGKVTTRHTEPAAGGSSACGRSSDSRRFYSRTGVRSLTQMRAAAYPGRAGSVRTSGLGPSAMTRDLSFSSITTTRLTDCGVALMNEP